MKTHGVMVLLFICFGLNNLAHANSCQSFLKTHSAQIQKNRLIEEMNFYIETDRSSSQILRAYKLEIDLVISFLFGDSKIDVLSSSQKSGIILFVQYSNHEKSYDHTNDLIGFLSYFKLSEREHIAKLLLR